MIKHILDLTFYGYFNTYMTGITLFNFIQYNGYIGFIIHRKRLQVHVSIQFIANDIVIIRLLVTGGGHLEFPHKKVDEKVETVLFQSFRG